MILGADKSNRKAVTICDRMTEKFTSGYNMNNDRERAACTIFKSPKHGNRPVVFVGGGKNQNTAEILDFSQSDAKWEIGKFGNKIEITKMHLIFKPRLYFAAYF